MAADGARRGSVGEVFTAFLRLGVTSFGGPIAHLGYFRDDLVRRRGWVDESRYAELVALSQFLPGPASSQVGFALGWVRAGLGGALAAFLAFTLPSAALLTALALGADLLGGPISDAVVAGLKIVAVAVVAHAVIGMARTLAPDTRRALIAVGALVLAALLPGTLAPLAAIASGALAGLLLCRTERGSPAEPLPGPGRAVGVVALGLFVALVGGLPVLALVIPDGTIALADAFVRSGALVFGGGHVVLPLLDAEVVGRGWVSADEFLVGYGAAQAVPGPLFTFAAYLGAVSDVGPGGILGAGIALAALFAPGLLLISGVLPFWGLVRTRPAVQALVRGANAAVVGVLAAALYDPVFTSGVVDPWTFAAAAVCFVLLVVRVPAWIVVLVGVGLGLGVEFLVYPNLPLT